MKRKHWMRARGDVGLALLAVPGIRADLVVGECVIVSAQSAPDGTLRAPRIQVSRDGVKPPQ